MALPFTFDVKRAVKELTEKSKLVDICKTKGGHISSGSGAIVGRLGSIRVYDICKICHLPYERRANAEETETYHKMFTEEFVL